MVKIVNNGGQYKITIPKEIAEAHGWDSNTRLRFVEDIEGNISLKPIEPATDLRNSAKRRANGK